MEKMCLLSITLDVCSMSAQDLEMEMSATQLQSFETKMLTRSRIYI